MAMVGPWTVTIDASASLVTSGTKVEITATANQSVTPTDYYVWILSSDGTAWYCFLGTTCYTHDSLSSPGSRTYYATVALQDRTSIQATSSTVTVTWTALPDSATFHALAPTRILDTRDGTGGLPGPFSSHVARTFQVADAGGVPANAIAVTGNLTVTQQTSLGFLFIGPVAYNYPPSSTLNFPVNDDRANAVTVALSLTGTLSVTYAAPVRGPTAHVIFDVTGYFTPDASGATYHPISPNRILDSRYGIGISGAFGSHVARTFWVTGGTSGIPASATAVTGNLTVTGQTSGGFLYLGPNAADNPTSSTLNFLLGDDRANAVTVALGPGGTLSATYAAPTMGPTAFVILDVTGYFTPDTGGATYHPLSPNRILDSRYGTGFSGALSSHVARAFQVTGEDLDRRLRDRVLLAELPQATSNRCAQDRQAIRRRHHQ